MMFNDRVLRVARQRVNATLTGTCTIEQQADALDEIGAISNTWTTVASDVACRIITAGEDNNAASENIGSAETMVEEYKLILPHGTTISKDYRVTVDGATYDVTRVVDRRSQQTDVQAIVARSRGDA